MLKDFLNLFKSSKKLQLLSSEFSDTEKIARSVFSPVNVNKSDELRTNVYKSPAEMDEVSVNRLDYTNADNLKNLSKKIENPSSKRNYFGFAILNVLEIKECEANVVYSPIIEPVENVNVCHSDIKVGYVKERGKEFPAEINYKISQLIKKSRFYKDPAPHDIKWGGSDLE